MITFGSVTLRRVEPEDHAAVLRWQNDPEIFPRMDYERPFSLDDVRISEEKAAAKHYPFIVEVEGQAIGRIGLFNASMRNRTASLYLFIGERSFWGRGLAKDALRALLTYAFDTLNLSLVQLYMLGDNDRAGRLYKSIGFIEEARLRDRSFSEGRYIEHVIMSITREEFQRALGR